MEASPPPRPPTPDRAARVRWLVFVLACAASWLLYLHRYSWGVIKPTFKQENPSLTDTDLGWLDSAFQVTYALGQVRGGVAGGVLGARRVSPVLSLLWSAAVWQMGWIPSFWPLFGVRAGFGLAQAGAYPVMSQMSRRWFPPSARTTLQGWVAALGRIGAACCPPILAALLMGACGLSWKTALLVLAVPGFGLAAAFWLLVRNSPREHPWSNPAEQELVEGKAAP